MNTQNSKHCGMRRRSSQKGDEMAKPVESVSSVSIFSSIDVCPNITKINSLADDFT